MRTEKPPSLRNALRNALMLENGGVVCFVGAGGKTSLMFRVARELSDAGESVLTTTTTKMMKPAGDQSPHVVVAASPQSVLTESEKRLKTCSHFSAAFARDKSIPGKLVGFPPSVIDELFKSGRFRWILVEADGSAGRPLKAPAVHEPVVPDCSGWVVGVAGLRGIGKPLGADWVFRPGLYAELTGLKPETPVTETSVAMAIAHKNGIMKGCPASAQQLVFLNLSDERSQLNAGRKIARLLKESDRHSLKRVVIGKALHEPPVVEYYDMN